MIGTTREFIAGTTFTQNALKAKNGVSKFLFSSAKDETPEIPTA